MDTGTHRPQASLSQHPQTSHIQAPLCLQARCLEARCQWVPEVFEHHYTGTRLRVGWCGNL